MKGQRMPKPIQYATDFLTIQGKYLQQIIDKKGSMTKLEAKQIAIDKQTEELDLLAKHPNVEAKIHKVLGISSNILNQLADAIAYRDGPSYKPLYERSMFILSEAEYYCRKLTIPYSPERWVISQFLREVRAFMESDGIAVPKAGYVLA